MKATSYLLFRLVYRCCHGSKTSACGDPWESQKQYWCTTFLREWWKANIYCNQSKCRRSCRSLEVWIYIPLSLHHSFVNSYCKIRAWLLVACGWLSQVRAILLDHSFSGSGTITDRLDHLLPSHSAGSTDSSVCIGVCSITNLFGLLIRVESVLKQFVLTSPLSFLCSKTICS